MHSPSIIIVGAGMSGLCAAIQLRDAGFDDVTILEKAAELGGTWRDNRYPGVACDVPSRSYAFSFAPNPEWTQMYSPGNEIQAYLLRVAEDRDVRSLIRFNAEVAEAAWANGQWDLKLADGATLSGDVLITATGVLHQWQWPDIPGLADFAGQLVHTAAWPAKLDLEGRRVGLIGNGSTGVQVAPELAEQSAALTLFQRTPQWVFPTINLRYGPVGRALARHVPAFNRIGHRLYSGGFEQFAARMALRDGPVRSAAQALCRLHLRTVKDPALRAKLTPEEAPGCRRLVMSGRFYGAVQQRHVDIVTQPIAAIGAEGVRTIDDAHHDLDVLVCATGFDFHAHVRPINVVGADGITLEQAWSDGPRAYNTVAMPGFPNFFMLVGPHSPVGSAPVIGTAEAQARYITQCVRILAEGRARYLAPTQAATDAYNDGVTRALPNTIWATGCSSYYLDSRGLPELWPWSAAEHRQRLGRPALEDFDPDGLEGPGFNRPLPIAGLRLPRPMVLASNKSSALILLNNRVPIGLRRKLLDATGDTLKPPAGTLVHQEDLDGILGRRIVPPTSDGRTILLHFHGGAFAAGSARSHCGFAGQLAHRLAATAFVPDYRLAPEHPYPAAIEDAVIAYHGLIARGYDRHPIVISGDSAGGHLALQLALRLQREDTPSAVALLLLCPWLDLEAEYPAADDQDPLVSGAFLREAAHGYLQGASAPSAADLGASLGALPPTLVQTVPGDPTRPGALAFADAARSAGSTVVEETYPELWHDFQLAAGLLRDADTALERAGAFQRAHAVAPRREALTAVSR